ncbi:MAG: COG1361 S-layer family protein [Candidatus Bathyarchaeia archaeon]
MKTKLGVCLISVLLLSSFLTLNALHVSGQASVDFRVSRVVWGEDPDNPAEAYPGDASVALTVEVQNYSNETIKGVEALLTLAYPFTDAYGNPNATATGEPVEIPTLPQHEILPVSFFTLTFSLSIDKDASPASYSHDIALNYFVKSESGYLKGESKTITINLRVSKTPTTMTCSVSPERIERDETVDVSGSIDPPQENVTVTLLYKRENGSEISRTVRTAADGAYKDSYQTDSEGVWTVNASWVGDKGHKGSWASASFEVIFPVSIRLTTSENRLVGGVDNPFNVTITNNGGVSLSTVDATLTIPSPLVVHGNNSWAFRYLEPEASVLIPLTIFAPVSVIGSTYQGEFQLGYRDAYGQSHIDTYPINLIIIGRIELIVYDKVVSPQPPSPGSRVTITATVLNKGNVAAMYANASILPSPALDLSGESTAYIGEVEENSPIPFTVMANVGSGVENGTYPVTIGISYRDDQYLEHSLNFTVDLVVVRAQTGQDGSTGGWGILSILREGGWVLLTLLGASVVILILYRRRLSRQTSIDLTPPRGDDGA